MSYNRILTFVAASLIFTILGCTFPNTGPQPPASEIQTAAAQTLQAIFTPSVSAATESSPGINTNVPDATTTSVGAVTITPTYSVPMLTVSEQTNCRAGPGQDYEILATYLPGIELEIVGRYEPDNYWLVKSAESPTGTCWLWGEFVELTGSHDAVPSVIAPSTSTQPPPQAPSIIEWRFSCSGGILTFTVSWTDRAVDETGYRVFRNGEAIAELPANSTSHVDTFEFTSGENVDYYLQVYGPSGSTNSSVMRMQC